MKRREMTGTRSQNKISEVLKEADLILTTGGVSVGDKDLVPDVIESLNGRVLFHGIRVKPGMPTIAFGSRGHPCSVAFR